MFTISQAIWPWQDGPPADASLLQGCTREEKHLADILGWCIELVRRNLQGPLCTVLVKGIKS